LAEEISSVKVVWDNGRPVAGATIRKTGDNQAIATSDSQGVATLPATGSKAVEYEFTHPDAVASLYVRSDEARNPLRLEHGASVSGVIVQADGVTKAAGASVVVLGGGRTTVSNQDGEFVLRGLKSESIKLGASLGGHRSYKDNTNGMELRPAAWDKLGPIKLQLLPNPLLSVVVTSKETFEPVANAHVILDKDRDVLTGADGVATFESPSVGVADIRILADGFAQDVKRVMLQENEDHVVESFLTSGYFAEGRITNANHEPVPGVLVRASIENGSTWPLISNSQPDGSFRIENLVNRPGSMKVQFEKDGYLPVVQRVALPDSAQGTPAIEVTLTEARTIALALSDQDGDAPSPGKIVYRDTDTNIDREAPIDSTGHCTLNVPNAAGKGIAFWPDSPGIIPEAGILNVPATSVSEQNITLRRADFIDGKVVSASRMPIANAAIFFRNADQKPLSWKAFHTNDDGTFQIPNVGDQGFIKVVADGYAAAPEVFFPQSSSAFEIELEPEAVVAGRIIDGKTGNPIKQFNVVLTGSDSGNLSSTAGVDFSSDAGSFQLPRLSSDTYNLQVRAKGYTPVDYLLDNSPGGSGSTHEIKLAEMVSQINGTVQTEDGKAISNAEITLVIARDAKGIPQIDLDHPDAWRSLCDRVEIIRTDAEGRFSFPDVTTTNAVDLIVGAVGSGTRRVRRLEKMSAAALQDIHISLEKECPTIVSGIPRNESEELVIMKAGGEYRVIPNSKTSTTLAGLSPGKYQIFSRAQTASESNPKAGETNQLVEVILTPIGINEIKLDGVLMTSIPTTH
ncbi:MAG: carboxypeptidase regulatory-like domain-containing protein, partial [Candidatus Sumerlaeota bacterium]